MGSIAIPGAPLASFDIGYAEGGVLALADRSNSAVDLIDTRTHRVLAQVGGFAGAASGGQGGPNGVAIVDGQQVWAGDGHSLVRIIDLASHQLVASVSTGGARHIDELAYDPRDHLVIAANNADKPAFVSFISTRAPYQVVGKLALPRATGGLEQPVWDAATGQVYLAIPELDGRKALGGVAVIDPIRRRLLATEVVGHCMPAGLAVGPQHQLLVGCSDDAVSAGFQAKSMLLDEPGGKVLASFPQVGGSDEVWYDAGSGRYGLAAVANPGGPVLGVIDAGSRRWLGNVPSGGHAHSIAADTRSGEFFVPVGQGDASCPSGCVAVFSRSE